MKNTNFMRKNIVRIGAGNSAYSVLSGLKKYNDLNIAAIVTMADNGGSSGKLREEFGTLPSGDVRRVMVALSRNEEFAKSLFEHRFEGNGSLAGHTLGNLILTGMEQIHGNLQTAIDKMGDILDLAGKVIPSTLSDIHLQAVMEDGEVVIGETHIDIPKRDPRVAIRDISIIGNATINPQAVEVIEQADLIILGPGDLYTSLIPNLLIPGMCEAIKKSHAKIILIMNLMTKPGETYGFYADDFVRVIEQYLGIGTLHSILVNNQIPTDHNLLDRYEAELKSPLIIKDRDALLDRGYQIVERDLIGENLELRHDPTKTTRVLRDYIDGWIK